MAAAPRHGAPAPSADVRRRARTALFNGNVAPLRVKRAVKREIQRLAGQRVIEMARDTGKDVIDTFLDLAHADDFWTDFMSATMNTDASAVAEIFPHPTAVPGLSDAGAHIAALTCPRRAATLTHLKTTLNLDEDLLQEAQRLSGLEVIRDVHAAFDGDHEVILCVPGARAPDRARRPRPRRP